MDEKKIESEIIIKVFSDENVSLDIKSISPDNVFLMIKTLMVAITCWLMSDDEDENELGRTAIMAIVEQAAIFAEWDKNNLKEIICKAQTFFCSTETETAEDKSEVCAEILAAIFISSGINMIEKYNRHRTSSAMMTLAKLEEINRRARDEVLGRNGEGKDS